MLEQLEVLTLLSAKTPDAWVDIAIKNVELLLLDHAHCEKKAAATALNIMYRYPEYTDFLPRFSKLAREELRHFEQVMRIMKKRHLAYYNLEPGRYARALRQQADQTEPQRYIDLLLICALIEARSCERFSCLYDKLDDELNAFYKGLCQAESRHALMYVEMAEQVASGSVDERLQSLSEYEASLITTPDACFRFHSGIIL